MQVEEICKCVYVRHLKSLTDGLLIIWRWSDTNDDETDQIHEEQTSCNDSSTEGDNANKQAQSDSSLWG